MLLRTGRLIAAARARGDPSVRVGDVVLPNGMTLRFEVQFGEQAGSLTSGGRFQRGRGEHS